MRLMRAVECKHRNVQPSWVDDADPSQGLHVCVSELHRFSSRFGALEPYSD